MKNKHTYFLSFFILFGSALSFSQNSNIDSLKSLIKTDRADTNKLIHLNKLSREYEMIGNYDSAMLIANSALELSNVMLEKNTDVKIKRSIQKFKATSYNNIGIVHDDQSNFPEALKNYLISLKIRQEIDDKPGQAASYNNIGVIYEQQGNYPEAFKNHYASLKIEEALGSKDGIADSYTNIGNVYADQSNYPEALKNHLASLKIRETINDRHGIGVSHNNIGLIYYYQGNYEEALKNHFAALKIRGDLGEKRGVAISHNNIGLIYYDQAEREKNTELSNEKYDLALKNYFAALRIQEEIGMNASLALSCNNIGNVYIKQKKYSEAEEYLLRAEKILKKIGYREFLRGTYRALSRLDSAKGNFKGAYENHKNYILYRDSLNNEETRKKTIQSQMTYEFEKKAAIAEAEHKKELESQEAMAEEKSRRQKIIIVFVICGLLLVMIFAGFIFRSLKITRKQKDIIENQKNTVEEQKRQVELQKSIIEEHQKEIVDSITYARRIQLSLLPTEKYIDKNLKRLNSKK